MGVVSQSHMPFCVVILSVAPATKLNPPKEVLFLDAFLVVMHERPARGDVPLCSELLKAESLWIHLMDV